MRKFEKQADCSIRLHAFIQISSLVRALTSRLEDSMAEALDAPSIAQCSHPWLTARKFQSQSIFSCIELKDSTVGRKNTTFQ